MSDFEKDTIYNARNIPGFIEATPIVNGPYWDVVEIDENRILRILLPTFSSSGSPRIILVGLNQEREEIFQYILDSARLLSQHAEEENKN